MSDILRPSISKSVLKKIKHNFLSFCTFLICHIRVKRGGLKPQRVITLLYTTGNNISVICNTHGWEDSSIIRIFFTSWPFACVIKWPYIITWPLACHKVAISYHSPFCHARFIRMVHVDQCACSHIYGTLRTYTSLLV